MTLLESGLGYYGQCCASTAWPQMCCPGLRQWVRLRSCSGCAECQVAIVGKHVVAVWMVLCFLAGVAYCAYRRTQLREKFGIAGALHLLHYGALPISLSLSC